MFPLRSWIYHGQRPDGNAVMKIRFAAFARMSQGGGKCNMNTLEVLTLVLVIFAALTYIEIHQNRKLAIL